MKALILSAAAAGLLLITPAAQAKPCGQSNRGWQRTTYYQPQSTCRSCGRAVRDWRSHSCNEVHRCNARCNASCRVEQRARAARYRAAARCDAPRRQDYRTCAQDRYRDRGHRRDGGSVYYRHRGGRDSYGIRIDF